MLIPMCREILTVGAGLGESSVSNCSVGSKVDEAVINSVKKGWDGGWVGGIVAVVL